jgi:hypothetical protein
MIALMFRKSGNPAPDRVFISQLYYELSGTLFTNPPSSIQSAGFS